MPENRDYRAEWWALSQALSAWEAEAADEEILDAARDEGEDIDAAASRVRAVLFAAVNTFKKHRLIAAREKYRTRITELSQRVYRIPKRFEEQRALLERVFEQHPDLGEALLTAQHRDFTDLVDEDVASYLKQLQELGVLEPFSEDGTQ